MTQPLNVSHRKQSFHISYSNKDSPYNMQNYHLHDDYELYYLMNGRRLYYIEGRQYIIEPETLVFIRKNVAHKTGTPSHGGHERVVINFHDNFIPNEYTFLVDELFAKKCTIIAVPKSLSAQVYQLMDEIQFEYSMQKRESVAFIQSLLMQLVVLCKRLVDESDRCQNREHTETYERHFIQEIIVYIHNHYMDQNVSLQHIAKQFNFRPHHISRAFQHTIGTTISEYVNMVRIHVAQRLLIESKLPTHDIALKVGYSNATHFYRVFKKITESTPSRYRKSNFVAELHTFR